MVSQTNFVGHNHRVILGDNLPVVLGAWLGKSPNSALFHDILFDILIPCSQDAPFETQTTPDGPLFSLLSLAPFTKPSRSRTFALLNGLLPRSVSLCADYPICHFGTPTNFILLFQHNISQSRVLVTAYFSPFSF